MVTFTGGGGDVSSFTGGGGCVAGAFGGGGSGPKKIEVLIEPWNIKQYLVYYHTYSKII